MMKMAYNDILFMPVKRFYDLIKWKTELEEDKQKVMQEQEKQIRNMQKKRK